jgi:hypothetical protein
LPLRAVIVALALCGLAIATYLTFYQVGIIATVWDPFFGEGSRAGRACWSRCRTRKSSTGG